MKIKQNPDVIHRFIKDRLYVFDDKKMTMHTYNQVGSFIWKQAQKPIEEEDIINKVCQAFSVDTNQAKQDVQEFIHQETKKMKLFILIDKK